jgi:23S rRNA (adenine2503-C2)-methyltransferase
VISSIYNLSKREIINIVVTNGFKRFQGEQLFEFIYRNKVKSLDECFNVKKEVRDLFVDFSFDSLVLVKEQRTKDNKTIKLLYKLLDDNLVETVIMRHTYGLSICISTQVGCNMGCVFCASGKLKKIRDLTTAEMILQFMNSASYLNERIDYCVVMGIGEPFDNFNSLCDFLYTLNDSRGLGLGARHITVSTCGIPDKIIRFKDLGIQVNLAISLHAATDSKRNTLMPINKAYPLKTLFIAIDSYLEVGRRVTIEYILLRDVNDTDIDAANLIKLLRGKNVYVNLIPYNPNGSPFIKPSLDSQNHFAQTLIDGGLDVTLRRELGDEIDAACGQLRGNNL